MPVSSSTGPFGFDLQALVAAALVVACGAYSLWSLMPGRWRQRLAVALLRIWARRPDERGLAGPAWLRRAAQASGGCACDGCPGATATGAPRGAQPVQVHRRRPR